MITDIHITNFRGIGDLELTGLKRVNLIVGDNNSGKTSLLEAIVAAASPGFVPKLPGIFRANSGKVAERYFKWLLKDREMLSQIKIHGPGKQIELSMTQWGEITPPPGTEGVQEFGGVRFWHEGSKSYFKSRVVSVQHQAPDSIIDNFADTVRSPENERRLESLLNRIDPRIQSARLDRIEGEEVVSLDVGLSERVPLSQLGQGVHRIVSMVSDLLGSKPDLFLIDELENGVHYTALRKVWRGLAEIAEVLNIQIFATTHSKECLAAAYRVFGEHCDQPIEMDLAVIQMMIVDGAILSRVLDGEHIEAAMDVDIELR